MSFEQMMDKVIIRYYGRFLLLLFDCQVLEIEKEEAQSSRNSKVDIAYHHAIALLHWVTCKSMVHAS